MKDILRPKLIFSNYNAKGRRAEDSAGNEDDSRAQLQKPSGRLESMKRVQE